MKGCAIPGCAKKHEAKGYCSPHYENWRKQGHPLGLRAQQAEQREAFFARALEDAGDACILWPFSVSVYGYGKWNVGKRIFFAHREACRRAHGECPPDKSHAAHSCRTPLCCNPKHLRWATPQENNDDKKLHGTVPAGEEHPKSKISDAAIRAMRALRGKMTSREIANRFGISHGYCAAVLSEKYRRSA